MLACIVQFICNLIALMAEKNEQLLEVITQQEEIITQQEEICECLDAVVDPDAECPECPEDKMFRMRGFDVANGESFWNDPNFVRQATVNGVAVPDMAFDASFTTKSQYDAEIIAAVNAEPDFSMALEPGTDVNIPDTGAPFYIISYSGTGPAQLVIDNVFTGNTTFTIDVDAAGVCTAVATDGAGNPITSSVLIEEI